MPDENGETRRERNIRVGEYTPEFILPFKGRYLWDWYSSLNESISRIFDGNCRLIPPSELHAWSVITGNLVYPIEYDILKAMDVAYCDEINKEIASLHSKREENQKKEMKKR